LRKAKILITLGPTSRQPEVVEKLILAGANGVRMNMSHGTHEEKAEDIARARAAAVKVGRPLAILVDLSGPKIRTRRLKDGQPVKLTPGSLFILTTEDIAGDEKRVATNYPELPRVVQPGTRLLLDEHH
jgi:pyruvate kinase